MARTDNANNMHASIQAVQTSPFNPPTLTAIISLWESRKSASFDDETPPQTTTSHWMRIRQTLAYRFWLNRQRVSLQWRIHFVGSAVRFRKSDANCACHVPPTDSWILSTESWVLTPAAHPGRRTGTNSMLTWHRNVGQGTHSFDTGELFLLFFSYFFYFFILIFLFIYFFRSLLLHRVNFA